jgi:hypothetical protein
MDSAVHDAMDRLVGEWDVTAGPFPGGLATAHGRTTTAWILGAHYLEQRTTMLDPVPDSVVVLGGDAGLGRVWYHYFDSRGVTRLYVATFHGHTWSLKRDQHDVTPLDFAQRFHAEVSVDGRTMTGAWEKSPDGLIWEHDFDLTCRRADGETA